MPRDGGELQLGEINLGGRPLFVPTIEQRHAVTVLRSNGCSERVIARLLRINRRTLTKHFKTELTDAREILIASLGSVIVNAALNGDWRAALSWLSRFGGPEWRRTENRLHGGLEDAPPIAMKARVVIVPAEDQLAGTTAP
jgi:hypothetical protein